MNAINYKLHQIRNQAVQNLELETAANQGVLSPISAMAMGIALRFGHWCQRGFKFSVEAFGVSQVAAFAVGLLVGLGLRLRFSVSGSVAEGLGVAGLVSTCP